MTEEEILEALDTLWGELTPEQVRSLRIERPEVVQVCQQVHERLWHQDGVDDV